MRNAPYPSAIGQGDGPGGRESPRAGQTGTLRTAVRGQQRTAAKRSNSVPLPGRRSSGGPRHAAEREAQREQRLLEEYCTARRQHNEQRRSEVEAEVARWTNSPSPAAARRSEESARAAQPSQSPSAGAKRRELGTPEHQQKQGRKAYGKFDYALRRDAPAVPRSAQTGTPMLPHGRPAPHHTTPPSGSRAERTTVPRGQAAAQPPGRQCGEVSPPRARRRHPGASGRVLWGDLCSAAQYEFTCEELQVLHPQTLRGLAVHYGFTDEQDIVELLEHHCKVQRGEEPARQEIPMCPAVGSAGRHHDPQDTWVRQSQKPQKGYSHLDYGGKRSQPQVRRCAQSGQPVVTRRQELEVAERRREAKRHAQLSSSSIAA
eukprot:TRINITY_DN7630_c0_g1_i1.p1 TRINITY_DN7630_c0_g1~~TRINITY_DN7630_c0_g1_i1.p1  ORF type:complete len:439 (+),score=109.16 TRINITY_DN7630_c0_g1_i1:196-1317(+)